MAAGLASFCEFFSQKPFSGPIFIVGAGMDPYIKRWQVLYDLNPDADSPPIHLFDVEPGPLTTIFNSIEGESQEYIVNPIYLGPANCETCGVVKMTLDDYCKHRGVERIGVLAVYGDQARADNLFEGGREILGKTDLIWTPSLIRTPFQSSVHGVAISLSSRNGCIYRRAKALA